MHSPEVATPVWRIATLFPYQGAWSEQEYLALETNRRVEFDNGFVEVHDVPTDQHQAIILYLSIVLNRFALQIGGVVRTAGLRLRLWDRKYREPDFVLLRNRDSKLRQENFWDGADLAVEVVSQSHEDRERNLVTKRTELNGWAFRSIGLWILNRKQSLFCPYPARSTLKAIFSAAAISLDLPFFVNLLCPSRRS